MYNQEEGAFIIIEISFNWICYNKLMDEENNKSGSSEQMMEDTLVLSSRYKNLNFIGEGGVGKVYKAWDVLLNKYVAIKIIEKKGLSEEARKRILREVEARDLVHENLVRYYDINEYKNYLAISMEFIEGTTLKNRLKKGVFKEKEVEEILYMLNDVLEYLHNKGVIHRDINPTNIFLTENKKIKLGDFGLAHHEKKYDRITVAGKIFGTPHYMSPEQISGDNMTKESDYYALGITIYELLSGTPPFSGNIMEIFNQHLKKEVPKLNVSDKFNTLIKGLTIKDPQKRWGYEEVKNFLKTKENNFIPFLRKIKKFFYF